MNAHEDDEVHPYLVMLLLLIQILVIIYETILSILNVTGSMEVFLKATSNESVVFHPDDWKILCRTGVYYHQLFII